jgi:hypothetical protein
VPARFDPKLRQDEPVKSAIRADPQMSWKNAQTHDASLQRGSAVGCCSNATTRSFSLAGMR